MAHNAVQPFPARRVDFHRGPRPDSKTATIVGCGAGTHLELGCCVPAQHAADQRSLDAATEVAVTGQVDKRVDIGGHSLDR